MRHEQICHAHVLILPKDVLADEPADLYPNEQVLLLHHALPVVRCKQVATILVRAVGYQLPNAGFRWQAHAAVVALSHRSGEGSARAKSDDE